MWLCECSHHSVHSFRVWSMWIFWRECNTEVWGRKHWGKCLSFIWILSSQFVIWNNVKSWFKQHSVFWCKGRRRCTSVFLSSSRGCYRQFPVQIVLVPNMLCLWHIELIAGIFVFKGKKKKILQVLQGESKVSIKLVPKKRLSCFLGFDFMFPVLWRHCPWLAI